MTKANMIKVLEAIKKSSEVMKESFADTNNEKMMNFERGMISGLEIAIMMLNNNKYANEIAKIYDVEI